MTERLTLPLTIYRSLLDHALREAPWECCGLLGGLGGEVRSYHPLTNRALTPRTRYFASPEDLLPAMRTMREAGETLLSIYHSHPEGVPFPSETDRELAFYPQTVYLIVGPLHPDLGLLSSSPPEIRGFLLGGPDIEEVEIQLEGREEDRRQILGDLLPEFGSAHPSQPDLEEEPGCEAACPVPPVVPPDEVSEETEVVIPTVDDLPQEVAVEPAQVLPEEAVPIDDLPEEVAVEPAQVVQAELVPIDDLPEEAAVEPALVVQAELVPVDDLPEDVAVEPAQVVQAELVPVDDLPEELAVEPAQVVQAELVPVDDLPEEAAVEPAQVLPEEAVPVDDLPEELAVEPAQVVQAELVPIDDLPEGAAVEPAQVVQEELAPIDDLPEGTSEEASLAAQEAVDSIEELPQEPTIDAPQEVQEEVMPSDGAPQEELVVEEIPPVAEPVPEAPSRLADGEVESGAGAPGEVGEGWASRITRKIRSAIVRVARWAFSGRGRQ